jgi:hypothetical protein
MSVPTEGLNKVISIIFYLALIAAVCVLTPILEISTPLPNHTDTLKHSSLRLVGNYEIVCVWADTTRLRF